LYALIIHQWQTIGHVWLVIADPRVVRLQPSDATLLSPVQDRTVGELRVTRVLLEPVVKPLEAPFVWQADGEDCRTLQDAAAKDVVISKEEVPKDGKYTAVFPVCLPDEGGFQWLDNWLKQNPSYTELSDRAILDWAQKSGITRLKPYNSRVCNDKPDMAYGLPLMDDKSIQKMISATAWMQRRNFVVMEIHANLMKEDRAKLVSQMGDFKKVALVVTGDPSKAFKQTTLDALLKDKQDAANAEFEKKLAEEKKGEEE
jgi:hypothetical protein